jgi:hypothetical protein
MTHSVVAIRVRAALGVGAAEVDSTLNAFVEAPALARATLTRSPLVTG